MKHKINVAFCLAVILALVLATGVLADDIHNNIVVTPASINLLPGGSSVNVGFYVQPIGAGSDGDAGCNFDSLSEHLTFDIVTPSGVTATPSRLTFSKCHSGSEFNYQYVTFSAGSTAVSGSVTYTTVDNTSGGSFDYSSAVFTINITPPADSTPPTLHLPGNMTAEATSASGANVTFSTTADDTNPEHPNVTCVPASGSLFGLGTTTVNCSATDAANNTANGSFTVTVEDTKPPVLTLPSDIVEEATGPDGATVTYSVTAIDVVDGAVTPVCKPISGSTFALGNSTVNCSAMDKLGHEATGSFTVTVQDTKPPVLSSCDAPDGVWHALNITLKCYYDDLVSGKSTVELSTSLVSGEENDNTIASADGVQACDAAGNCADSPADIDGNKIDRKAPQLGVFESPDSLWHATDITLKYNYTDNGSGPATMVINLTTDVAAGIETDDAIASANGLQACDNMGNCADSPADIHGNMIDKKAPTDIEFVGAITDGGVYYFSFVPAAPTCTAKDGGSGMDTCFVTGYDTGIGQHTLTATATDNVGNKDTMTLSYTVSAWTLKGFYQPVDMPDTWNSVKNGSTVPFKFEIFAGPTELTSPTYVSSFTAAFDKCDLASLFADPIEVTTTGATSLRYDPSGGQFINNWQTPKKAGSCYKVTMTTLDGSSLSALFRLK